MSDTVISSQNLIVGVEWRNSAQNIVTTNFTLPDCKDTVTQNLIRSYCYFTTTTGLGIRGKGGITLSYYNDKTASIDNTEKINISLE